MKRLWGLRMNLGSATIKTEGGRKSEKECWMVGVRVTDGDALTALWHEILYATEYR